MTQWSVVVLLMASTHSLVQHNAGMYHHSQQLRSLKYQASDSSPIRGTRFEKPSMTSMRVSPPWDDSTDASGGVDDSSDGFDSGWKPKRVINDDDLDLALRQRILRVEKEERIMTRSRPRRSSDEPRRSDSPAAVNNTRSRTSDTQKDTEELKLKLSRKPEYRREPDWVIKERIDTTPDKEGKTQYSEETKKRLVSKLYATVKTADKAGRLQQSEDTLKRLLELTPLDGRVWRRLSRLAKDRGDLFLAEGYIYRGLAKLPLNEYLWASLAELDKVKGDYDSAREHFARALEIDPRMVAIYHSWGRMESKCGNLETANELLERGITLSPTNSRMLMAMSILQDQFGKREAALALLDYGLSVFGQDDHPHLLHSRAIHFVKHAQTSEAREILVSLTETHPRFEASWLSLARLEENSGNVDASRELYKTACFRKGKTHSVELWQSWASMEVQANNLAGAAEVYTGAYVRFPKDVNIGVQWAIIEHLLGDSFKAKEIMAQTVRSSPTSPWAYLNAAILEFELNRVSSARGLFFKGFLMSGGGGSSAVKLPKSKKFRIDPKANAEDNKGVVSLVVSWAIMEWQLEAPLRARQLFSLAIRLASSKSQLETSQLGKEGSSNRASPVDPWIWLYFASFEKAQGNLVTAQNYIARSIQGNNQDPMAWKLWASLVGDNPGLAKKLMRQAAELELEYSFSNTNPPDRPTSSDRFTSSYPLGRRQTVNRRWRSRPMVVQDIETPIIQGEDGRSSSVGGGHKIPPRTLWDWPDAGVTRDHDVTTREEQPVLR